jgi:lysozyme family protein
MSDFGQAIATVVAVSEGGYQDRPDDPGNYRPNGELVGTKYGISAHSFPGEDIKNLTLGRAEFLYQSLYGGFSAIANQQILTKVLDLAIDMEGGINGPATVILQKALDNLGSAIDEDGDFGPKTIVSVNAADPKTLMPRICAMALVHYRAIESAKPGERAWFANWNARALWIPPVKAA